MPRQPLIDSPDLPPYGQRSSERRKEQNRIAQRQLRERRLQQEAAQTAELERRQTEIERLTRMVQELRDENIRLKTQNVPRRRQSVIPISSLSRCMSRSSYGSNPTIFSHTSIGLNPNVNVYHGRHSIDFGSLQRVNVPSPQPNHLGLNAVNISDYISEDDPIQCTTDLSDGDGNPNSPIVSFHSVFPTDSSSSREPQTHSTRTKKRVQEVHDDDDDDGEEERSVDCEGIRIKKLNTNSEPPSSLRNLSTTSPWLSGSLASTNVFKLSTHDPKPLVWTNDAEISPKQTFASVPDSNVPIGSFLPQSSLGSGTQDSSSGFFDSYSPLSPSISPVGSHRVPMGQDSIFSEPVQIRKGSTSGSSEISVPNSTFSTSDPPRDFTPYKSHLISFSPISLTPQMVMGFKSNDPWSIHGSQAQDHDNNLSAQISGTIFDFISSPQSQSDHLSSGLNFERLHELDYISQSLN